MHGQHTVLIVDDDASIRLLCRLNLQLDGFRVLESKTIGEARDVVASGDVDVVLLDVHVGDEDGRTFLAELRRSRPEIAVAMLTGSADKDEIGREGAAVIGKPFTLDELRETVEGLTAALQIDSRRP